MARSFRQGLKMNQNSNVSTLRIVDAAQNRAAEGLRVVEDLVRMHLENASLSREIKQVRHQLTASLASIDTFSILQARDPASDVGTQISTETEFERPSLQSVVRANFARVLQSLRTIEEYGKLLNEISRTKFPQEIEQLRYKTYQLEKAVANACWSIDDLAGVAICVLIDAQRNLSQFETLVAELIRADVGLIQLRDKHLSDRNLIERGKVLSRLTQNSRTRWVMNDRADLAVLSGADGVHVGQDDLELYQARKIVGPGKMIGVSTHNLEQAQAAELAGASYIGVGPVFPSATKSFTKFATTDFVTSVASEIMVPAFAIGGIDENNVADLARLGIRRVAVSKSVIDSEDKPRVIRALRDQLQDKNLVA